MAVFSFLTPKAPGRAVPAEKVHSTYCRLRLRALFGIFIGYAGFYVVRNNFTLSTPLLMDHFHWSKSDIGLLSTCMLVMYGLSKGFMSSLADKANPKLYMALGLFLSAVMNLLLGFSTEFWMFVMLVVLNGLFQGMGAGPSFIVLGNWFPRSSRGRFTALWNISHNTGGGLVAPIATGALALLGAMHWQTASFVVPALVALLVVAVMLRFGAGTTYTEGLPPLADILPQEAHNELVQSDGQAGSQSMSAWAIFRKEVLPNRGVWYVSFVDIFVYMTRFGVLTWLPIYLLKVKGFSKTEMALAFAFFEWAAIPSTLLAGVVTDKVFKGNRMPLAIICLGVILVALFGYWRGTSIAVVGVSVAVIGCMIYPPQFLASVQTVDLVPAYAIGSATGLRGLLSYIAGASLGTWLFGVLADRYGWHAGFCLLIGGVLACIVFCLLTHREARRLDRLRTMREATA